MGYRVLRLFTQILVFWVAELSKNVNIKRFHLNLYFQMKILGGRRGLKFRSCKILESGLKFRHGGGLIKNGPENSDVIYRWPLSTIIPWYVHFWTVLCNIRVNGIVGAPLLT